MCKLNDRFIDAKIDHGIPIDIYHIWYIIEKCKQKRGLDGRKRNS